MESILFRRLGEPGWLEVGVLALAIDATRSGGKGHEPVLARLDLNLPEQLAFLAQVLSGEEIRLTAEERRAWLFVWLGFWAAREDDSDLSSVLRFPPNRQVLEEVWKSVCTAIRDEGPISSVLDSLVSQATKSLAQEAPSAQRNLDRLVEAFAPTSSPPEKPAPAKAWEHLKPFLREDLAAGHLLVVPLLGGFDPGGWEETLVSLVDRVKLFSQDEGPGDLRATGVRFALDSWSISSERILKALLERSPLLWWLQDEYFLARIIVLLEQASVSPLAGWRLALARRVLRCEQAWRTSLVVSGINKDRDRDLTRDLTRDRDRDRDLAWDLTRALDLARALDLGRDRARARDLAWALDRALDRARALDLALALDQALDRLSRNPPFQEAALQLFSEAIQAILLGLLVKESKRPIQRSSLENDLASLQNAEAAASPLAGTPFHRQAIEEWEQVLDSPLSPIPLLEDALSREWNELPTDSETIVALFKRAVAELERKVTRGEAAP
jgi:hypothetical protein